VLGEAQASVIDDELHTGPEDGELTAGPLVREHFFPGRPNRFDLPNQDNLDAVRAQEYAHALIRKKARELFTVDGTTIGTPRLRPGNHIEVRGMRPPFDGFFYLQKTVHSIGADGYRTKFTACRPGMELPGAQGTYQEQT
jgi:hypothetical protein